MADKIEAAVTENLYLRRAAGGIDRELDLAARATTGSAIGDQGSVLRSRTIGELDEASSCAAHFAAVNRDRGIGRGLGADQTHVIGKLSDAHVCPATCPAINCESVVARGGVVIDPYDAGDAASNRGAIARKSRVSPRCVSVERRRTALTATAIGEVTVGGVGCPSDIHKTAVGNKRPIARV